MQPWMGLYNNCRKDYRWKPLIILSRLRKFPCFRNRSNQPLPISPKPTREPSIGIVLFDWAIRIPPDWLWWDTLAKEPYSPTNRKHIPQWNFWRRKGCRVFRSEIFLVLGCIHPEGPSSHRKYIPPSPIRHGLPFRVKPTRNKRMEAQYSMWSAPWSPLPFSYPWRTRSKCRNRRNRWHSDPVGFGHLPLNRAYLPWKSSCCEWPRGIADKTCPHRPWRSREWWYDSWYRFLSVFHRNYLISRKYRKCSRYNRNFPNPHSRKRERLQSTGLKYSDKSS